MSGTSKLAEPCPGDAPTPPPAEPDGGEGEPTLEEATFLVVKQARRIADLEQRLAEAALERDHERDARRDAHGRIRTLEERLRAALASEERVKAELSFQSGAAYRSDLRTLEATRERDEALATLAERDRRIAELEAGLKRIERNADDGASVGGENPIIALAVIRGCARALLSPATDKGGE